jgi:hypothetical protein
MECGPDDSSPAGASQALRPTLPFILSCVTPMLVKSEAWQGW